MSVLSFALAFCLGLVSGRAQAEVSTDSAGGFVFAAFSDSRGSDRGINKSVLSRLVSHIKEESGARVVVFPGDMIKGGGAALRSLRSQFSAWREVMAPLYAEPRLEGLKVYPGLGNHEVWGRGGPEAFRQAFPDLPGNGPEAGAGLTYSFDKGGVHFVMLDTTGSGEGGRSGAGGLPLAWLRADLAAARASGVRHIFVFGHDPAFPVSPGHIKDSLPRVGKRRWKGSDRADLKARDAFWDLLREFEVAAYVCGHEHVNAVESVRGVFQVTAGAGGAPLARLNPCSDPEGRVAEEDLEDFEKTKPYYELLSYPHGRGGNCQAGEDFWGGAFFGYAVFEVSDSGVGLAFWGVEPKPGSKTEVPEGASLRLMHSRRLR
ncbi:MAG: metallophosphoesterase [Elusimicrobia bacterium]|nr:metallophosphoesterase [Elusimicrobiota bacterium]